MEVTIISPDKELFRGEAQLVQFPGEEGSFEVLPDHAMMIASLAKGDIRIVTAGGATSYVPVQGGVVEVRDNVVLVLVS